MIGVIWIVEDFDLEDGFHDSCRAGTGLILVEMFSTPSQDLKSIQES